MHSSLALAALAAVAYAAPSPQGVSQTIAPAEPPPAGCTTSQDGTFQIAAVNITSTAHKRDIVERQSSCGAEGSLTLKLKDGVLTDAKGRIGSIVANNQFQFDGPPAQTGSKYTGGFSGCANGSLALGGSAVFYQCLSGTFYNLYNINWAPQCNPVTLQILPCSGSGSPKSPSVVGSQPDGQPTGGKAGPPINQINDGQIQGPTGGPPAAVGEHSDGQPQVPPPVNQIGDGQVQAPNGSQPPVNQIGDGQVQAPTRTTPPVNQIGDGQVQVPAAPTGGLVSQIGDGQIQTNGSAPIPFTGAAAKAEYSIGLVIAGLVGVGSTLL